MEKSSILLKEAHQYINTADHLCYVTFPTVNDNKILMAIAENIYVSMITAMEALLQYEKEFKGKAKNFIDLYVLMKSIYAADFDKKEEFRKHVTLISHLNRRDLNVDIPVISEYYYKTREFFALVQQVMK